MQSKPSPIATLGNELNIDDVTDKLTSSTGSSSSTQQSSEATHHHHQQQQQNQPHTDILFKTKSGKEMKAIYGLLQWKNSLIYNDNVSQCVRLDVNPAMHTHTKFHFRIFKVNNWRSHRKLLPPPVCLQIAITVMTMYNNNQPNNIICKPNIHP